MLLEEAGGKWAKTNIDIMTTCTETLHSNAGLKVKGLLKGLHHHDMWG